jgi:iron-sulfur cluster assembly protein
MEQTKEEDDYEFQIGDGVTLLVDPMSRPMLEGLKVDFVDSLTQTGFKFINPNATASCACGSSFSA